MRKTCGSGSGGEIKLAWSTGRVNLPVKRWFGFGVAGDSRDGGGEWGWRVAVVMVVLVGRHG